MSAQHFVIDENQKIGDLGSSKGTFFWVSRENHKNLEETQIFLIGKTEIVIERIYFEERRIILRIGSNVMEVSKKDSPFWIGSHKRCQLNVEGKTYMACIDVLNLKFHSLLESDDYDC